MKVSHTKRTKSKMQSLLYSLEDTREWIIQADTKGGFLLTINGVIASFMVQQVVLFFGALNKGQVPFGIGLGLVALFGCYLYGQSYSLWHTIQVFVPRTPASEPEHLKRTRHVFNYSLVRSFPSLDDTKNIVEEYNSLTLEELEDELLARLQVDSIVCTEKYNSFQRAFRGLLWTLFFALGGFLCNQIFLTTSLLSKS